MNIKNKYFSCNIPSLPYGDSATFKDVIYYAKCIKFTLNNVEYKIDDYINDYPTATAFNLSVDRTNNKVRINVVILGNAYTNLTSNILDDLDYYGYSLKIDCGIGSYIDNNIPVDVETYFTSWDTDSPTINVTNCVIVDNVNEFSEDANPTLKFWNFSNTIRIRANVGYTFTGGTYNVTTEGQSFLNRFIEISADGTELTLTNYGNDGTFPTFYPITPFVLNAVAVPSAPLDVDNDLTNVTNSNPDTSISYGARYQATLSVASGYYVGDVLITMDGNDITADVYDAEHNTIDIPSVTGNIYIRATAILNPTITNNLTGCTTNNASTSVNYGAHYQATITANTGYSLENASVLITMGGIELFTAYNNGVIDIPEVTGNVVITIIATTIETLTIKSVDGITTFESIPFVHISKILYSINNNTRTLRVDGVDYTWVQLIPEGKVITGLSLTANATRYIIPVGIEVNVNYRDPLTLYECLVDEVEPTDSFTLVLYKQNAEVNRVDKSSYITLVNTLYGTLRAQSSILNPTITIEYDGVIDFNYVYIPIWNRYYFVTDITYGIKGLTTLSLKEDVLMSHKDEIYRQSGLVARNEFEYNEDLIDAERVVKNNPVVTNQTITDESSLFSGQVGSIIISVVGGN